MTEGNITKIYPSNAADNPDNVLEQAVGWYESVLILGYDKNGCIDVRASNNIKFKDILWLIEKIKAEILEGDSSADD